MTSKGYEDIDWSKCSLCQTITTEKLQDPNHSKCISSDIAYKTFSDNIAKFKEYGDLPISLCHLENQDDSFENIFKKHSAKWHKTCKLKFNAKELKRASKRSITLDIDTERKNQYELPKRRRKDMAGVTKSDKCFFCDKESSLNEDLHEASTFTIDMRVKECALILGDMDLVRKLSAGDMRAQDAKYHRNCLVSLYNRKRTHQQTMDNEDKDKVIKAIAFAELVAHIDEERSISTDKGVTELILSELTKMYKTRLEQLKGCEISERIHSTNLKEKILAHFPDMGEYKVGKHVHLAFKGEVGLALKQAFEDRDSTSIQMTHCVNMLRNDILSSKYTFDGTFKKACQLDSIPPSLLSFVQMLLLGPSIKSQTESEISQEAKTICQIIQYNTYKRKRSTSNYAATSVRHQVHRETPLSLYTGIMIHGKTRNKELIDTLFKLGVSVSYDRVLSISTSLANSVIDFFEKDGVVCPPSLCKGVLTIGAYDNFDHNPSATSAKTSTHGTSISLFQEVSENNPGVKREKAILTVDGDKMKTIKALPDHYAIVPAAALYRKNPSIPKTNGSVRNQSQLPHTVHSEQRWLNHVNNFIVKEDIPETLDVTWAAFHANEQCNTDQTQLISTILPLFYEQAKSVAMIQHGIDVIREATHLLNPGQPPIIAMDQPLFALAKQIQWDKPEQFGEDKLLIMFGGFHIESAVERILGDWLEGSGWVEALVQAHVTSSGTADSFLKASHVARTRHAHQVTAAALYSLLQRSYTSYKTGLDDGMHQKEFLEWCQTMCGESVQFKYWFITFDLELAFLLLVKSFRRRDFMMYKGALAKLIPWFFALDHYNYSRWLPIHARDMASLREVHPAIADEFEAGHFSIAKTDSPFSAIAIDQAHEQNNGVMKGDGGTVGLTESPSALRRWMVAGPEMARIISEFETEIRYKNSSNDHSRHHEQTPATQKAFLTEVSSLTMTLAEMGSPFVGDTILYNIDTKDIADNKVVDTVNCVEKLGQEQYDKFVKDRLINRTESIEAPIRKNKLALFSTTPPKVKTKTAFEKATLTSNCNLYSNLYVSSLSRGGDLATFFQHENQAYPPALTKLGEMRSTKKSDLVDCLLEGYKEVQKPDFDAVLLDGAATVNMVVPIAGQTFHQYATHTLIPYILSYKSRRIDVVWDLYWEDSLKGETRDKRGSGKRRKVESHVRVPQNWSEFLRDSQNKTELFSFLADIIVNFNCDKVLVSNIGEDAYTNKPEELNTNDIRDCNHEEADTRLIIHAIHAQNSGYNCVLIRTVDTDVLVIAVSMSGLLNQCWMLLGKGNTTRYIDVRAVANNIGLDKAKGLPVFHAFTGCDTVSSFSTVGKKTAWDSWKACPEVTGVFSSLAEDPIMYDQLRDKLEHFVVVCYNRVSERKLVNEERQYLFTKRGRDVNSIPPTQAALNEHIKRTVYQGSYCWSKSMESRIELPDPGEWGWKRDAQTNRWKPLWTSIDEAAKALRELIKCGCKKGCNKRCKCRNSGLKCTALCACDDPCTHNDAN